MNKTIAIAILVLTIALIAANSGGRPVVLRTVFPTVTVELPVDAAPVAAPRAQVETLVVTARAPQAKVRKAAPKAKAAPRKLECRTKVLRKGGSPTATTVRVCG